jgi:hypothetical protein
MVIIFCAIICNSRVLLVTRLKNKPLPDTNQVHIGSNESGAINPYSPDPERLSKKESVGLLDLSRGGLSTAVTWIRDAHTSAIE